MTEPSGRQTTLSPALIAALDAGLTPYQICCCPKLEGTGAALVVGWSPDCLLHEGEEPDDE